MKRGEGRKEGIPVTDWRPFQGGRIGFLISALSSSVRPIYPLSWPAELMIFHTFQIHGIMTRPNSGSGSGRGRGSKDARVVRDIESRELLGWLKLPMMILKTRKVLLGNKKYPQSDVASGGMQEKRDSDSGASFKGGNYKTAERGDGVPVCLSAARCMNFEPRAIEKQRF